MPLLEQGLLYTRKLMTDTEALSSSTSRTLLTPELSPFENKHNLLY